MHVSFLVSLNLIFIQLDLWFICSVNLHYNITQIGHAILFILMCSRAVNIIGAMVIFTDLLLFERLIKSNYIDNTTDSAIYLLDLKIIINLIECINFSWSLVDLCIVNIILIKRSSLHDSIHMPY